MNNDQLPAEFSVGGERVSVYKAVRQLKQERQGLFNCLCSIHDDAGFVDELRALWPTVPVLANLRCGLWYVPQPDGTCYFKSTDGHMSNWSFSTVRLNLNVAELAAERGGVMIVDATRNAHKGGFPDALTKTIPIWTTVLNRAIAHLRGYTTQQPSRQQLGEQHTQTGSSTVGNEDAGWDTALHLPLWISRNEVQQIEARLPGWVDQLLATSCGPLMQLAKMLTKPLRPLWISQNTRIWVDQVAQPHELRFTPLYLVTASLPVHGQRRHSPMARHLQLQGAALPDDSSQGEDTTPPASSDSSCAQPTGTNGSTYVYVPGAGDDEESWAAGLTPDLLWQWSQQLLEAGPQGVHGVTQHLVQQHRAGRDAVTGVHLPNTRTHTQPSRTGPGSSARQPDAPHCLPPQGCRTVQPGSVKRVGSGAYVITGTGLLVGGWQAGASPDVWDYADAVLYCGQRPHPGMQAEASVARVVHPPSPEPMHGAGTAGAEGEARMLLPDAAVRDRHGHGSHSDPPVGVHHCVRGTCAERTCAHVFEQQAAIDLGIPRPMPPALCPSACATRSISAPPVFAVFPAGDTDSDEELHLSPDAPTAATPRPDECAVLSPRESMAPRPALPSRTPSLGELCKVESLSAQGIPCVPLAGGGTHPSEQAQGAEPCSSLPPVVPAAGAASNSFEFASSQYIVDISSPDYISVPLHLSPAEREALRAAIRAAEEAAAAACHHALNHHRRSHPSDPPQPYHHSLLTAAFRQLSSSPSEGELSLDSAPATPRPTPPTSPPLSHPTAPREYLWLPVATGKQAKKALADALPAALQFAVPRVRAGRTVLVCDDAGVDTCVCVALAVMLAMEQVKRGAGESGERLDWMQPVVQLDKSEVRTGLAQLSASYPDARPTKAFLKQIFQYYSGHQPPVQHSGVCED